MQHSTVMVVKEGAKRRMFLVSSNPYRDRENEIVEQKALEDYVKNFRPNELKFWHTGHAIGTIIKAEMSGVFLIEEAVERPDRIISTRAFTGKGLQVTSIKRVWDEIEANPQTFDGASVGFKYRYADKSRGGEYRHIFKHETSVLPGWAAANSLTFSEVLT